jgi:DNA topoisomerase-3
VSPAAPVELQRAGSDLSPAEGTRAVLDAIAGLSPMPRSEQSFNSTPTSAITRRPDTLPRTVSAPAETASLRCPRCKQGSLIEGQRGWGCDRWREGCRFVIWFETAGRRLTRAQFEALITKGKTRKATFVDGRGHQVEARLVLDPDSANGVQVESA